MTCLILGLAEAAMGYAWYFVVAWAVGFWILGRGLPVSFWSNETQHALSSDVSEA